MLFAVRAAQESDLAQSWTSLPFMPQLVMGTSTRLTNTRSPGTPIVFVTVAVNTSTVLGFHSASILPMQRMCTNAHG